MEEISLKGKRVLIIGGTNKVLQLACKGFLKKGCAKVTILCLHKDESLNLDEFPNVEIKYGDIHYLNSKQLSIAMMFHNYLVIASSKTTKRGVVNEDINEYYFERNIEDTENLLRIAKICKIEKVLILGTHYCSMDRKYFKLKLSQKHPYIKNRIMQEEMAITNPTNKLQIMTLELPYILGRNFQMTELFNFVGLQIAANKPVPYFSGGGAFCTMEDAAKAIVNIFVVGQQSKVYTLATMNLTWEQIIKEAKNYYGNNAKLVKISRHKLHKIVKKIKKQYDKKGIVNGLNLDHYSKLVTTVEKFDTYAICNLLKLKSNSDWKEEVHKTVDYVKGKFEDDLIIRKMKAKTFL
ncbi:MAG: NAD(P)-dependent oxidoreductase [Clostridia bacterium]|nr:NAD(P)-dependent oxidoreductase [Clostridia bacterium]